MRWETFCSPAQRAERIGPTLMLDETPDVVITPHSPLRRAGRDRGLPGLGQIVPNDVQHRRPLTVNALELADQGRRVVLSATRGIDEVTSPGSTQKASHPSVNSMPTPSVVITAANFHSSTPRESFTPAHRSLVKVFGFILVC